MAIFRGTGSASATADQTTIDTVTQAVVDAEAAQTAAEAAQTAAETAKTNAENLYGDLAAVSTAKTDAETAATTATTKASEASDDAADAQKLALNPVDSEFTLSDGSTTGYSALHYNTQTQLRYDNFDDRYLGSKSVEPSVDNDGDPLITGAMYFDTTDNLMYVWTGSGWVNVTPSSTVTISQVTDVTSNSSELNILDVSAQTPSDGNVLTYTTADGLNWATPSTETNDLTASVTWANVPDANITQSSVTQHQAALSITESQISDLQTYLTTETNDLTAAVTWANVPDANITQSSVTQHQAALSITESQISDFGTYEPVDTDILRADTADTITAPMRGTITDNTTSLTFDMITTNNFKAAVSSGTPTLTFQYNSTSTLTNAEGQSGNIYLNNTGATISADTAVFISSADLTTINTAGKYWLSYFCDGTNVFVAVTPALTSQGL